MSYEAIKFRKKLALFDEPWKPKVIAEMNDYQFFTPVTSNTYLDYQITSMRGLPVSICSSQELFGAPRLLACCTTPCCR